MESAPEAPRRLALVTLTALGVVYGDIGTSPLYALKEAFAGSHSVATTDANIFGILSLVLWSLILVVVIKYLTFVLGADNKGEGGILALLALLTERNSIGTRRRAVIVAAGLFGAALLYGDGVITPAISVLSAVEGLEVAAPRLHPFVVPLTIAVLLPLFLVQKHGTARIGGLFGPVMLLWFASIAAVGLAEVVQHPGILAAVDPRHAVRFFVANRWVAFLALGAVVLVITGVEALYADLGHFGKTPIRLGWYSVVFPALLLNYFGQGALLLEEPAAAHNPFYELVPSWGLYPMIALATLATIIASQALISASYSITRQAVQLGYFPRVSIVHTSAHEAGQIYIPEINIALMIGCIALVVGFGEASDLAAAYGMAVVGTMTMTTILFFFVTRRVWKWRLLTAVALVGLFLVVDLVYLSANLLKLLHGGWLPLVIAMLVYTLMTTWRAGRARLEASLRDRTLPMDLLLADVAKGRMPRVHGTAVIMTRESEGAPPVLLHHLKHNKVLHEKVLLLSIVSSNIPQVDDKSRLELEDLGHGFYRAVASYGFMETPDIHDLLQRCFAIEPTLVFPALDTTFILARDTILVTNRSGMARWRKHLFTFLARNNARATAFFNIPPNRVLELGAQVEL
ncbi:MAG TPA: KUP/HAK/KT family potassium transporter [Gemmatimonadota bacterium]|nr:KUP/HAK/KT family potassium transporter [Gemmatimonadota bacterium]